MELLVAPSKEKLEAEAKRFANIVFFIGAAGMMLAASLLKPLALSSLGPVIGEHVSFIVATIGIFVLASKRPELALLAIDRQCRKYGHAADGEPPVCQRCFQSISGVKK
jgi:hypothetical protein